MSKRASSSQSDRKSKSGALHAAVVDNSPYLRPVTSQFGLQDNSSAIWNEFLTATKRRKKLIRKLKEVGEDNGQHTQSLRRMMLELRQLTVKLIEDSLEIEYRSQFSEMRMRETGRKALNVQLPPIASFPEMDQKQDLMLLTEIITDVDHLFSTPNIRMLLPAEFPSFRNPFLLAKTIDELSGMDIPRPPKGGDLEQELHVLELLRYKRAATALLKAESQLLNKLPVSLVELGAVFKRMEEDRNAEMLLRIVGTLLNNDRTMYDTTTAFSDLRLLTDSVMHVTDFQMLTQLNRFKGDAPMRADVQAAVRQAMHACSFEFLTDRASLFLVEWVNSVLGIGNVHPMSPERGGRGGGGLRGDPAASLAFNQQQQMQHMSVLTGTDMASLDPSHQGLANPPVPGEDQFDRLPMLKRPPANRVTDLDRRTTQMKDTYGAALSPDGKMQRQYQYHPPRHGSPSKSTMSLDDTATATDSKSLIDIGSTGLPKKKSESLAKRIREEVELILAQKMKKMRGDDDDDSDGGLVTVATSKSKIANSIAESSKRGKMSELKNVDAADELRKMELEDFVCERTIAWGENNSIKGNLKITYDPLSTYVVARMIRIHDKLSIETCDFHEGDQEVLAFSMFSKLVLNLMTGYTLEALMNYPLNNRKRYLDPVFMQLMERITGEDPPSGKFFMDCDRIIFKSCNIINGIQVDIVIMRNLDCNGIVVHVVPIQGKAATSITKVGVDTHIALQKLQSLDSKKSIENGPITIALHDKELEVLLVNQRGLLTQAYSKWQSMIAVGEWLSNRLRVRRIPLVVQDASGAASFSQSLTGALDATSLLGATNRPDSPTAIEDAIKEKELTASQVAFANRGRSRPNTTGTSALQAAPTPLTDTALLEEANRRSKRSILSVELDRKIEIANNVILQWMQRNAPSIQGMTISLSAIQDLQLLSFTVTLTIPHPRVRRANGIGVKGGTMEDEHGMINFDAFNEMAALDDQLPDMHLPLEKCPDIVISMNYQLTAADLAIFGAIESLDEHRTVNLSGNTKDKHPNVFVWNILSRMKILFKGSLDDPYSKQCSADKPTSWELVYDRVLVRDIKAISGIVMVLTASAVSDEIVFESAPTDTTVHKKVGPKIMEYHDIVDFVSNLNLAPSYLEYSQRHNLSYRLVEKLKVVDDHDNPRLETLDYAETKMIVISLQLGLNKPDAVLGSVEINDQHTLLDLRTIMKYELERESLPKLYRFVYKGAPCAERQEPFRRAWECLPKLTILSKIIKFDARTGGAKLVEMNSKEDRGRQISTVNLEKDQRRVNMKMNPIPLPTLCRIQEGSGNVYLMHDIETLGLKPNDVIRIGNVLGRDYVIQLRSKLMTKQFPNMVVVAPTYDLRGECEFTMPTQGNMVTLAEHPENSRITAPDALGYKYILMEDDKDERSFVEIVPGTEEVDPFASTDPRPLSRGFGASRSASPGARSRPVSPTKEPISPLDPAVRPDSKNSVSGDVPAATEVLTIEDAKPDDKVGGETTSGADAKSESAEGALTMQTDNKEASDPTAAAAATATAASTRPGSAGGEARPLSPSRPGSRDRNGGSRPGSPESQSQNQSPTKKNRPEPEYIITDNPPYSAVLEVGIRSAKEVEGLTPISVTVGGATINVGGSGGAIHGSGMLSRQSSMNSIESGGSRTLKKQLSNLASGAMTPAEKPETDYKSELQKAAERKALKEQLLEAYKSADGTVWYHVWIWKCVMPEQDERPQWRQLYDDGMVPYEYTYQSSRDFIKFFRVKVYYRVMEVICTDARCPDMFSYRQRVDEMSTMSFEYYMNLAYNSMVEWYPDSTGKGVDAGKCMKLVQNMKIFPDIKKPVRVSQLDILFHKLATHPENAYNSKILNMTGLRAYLKELGLIRFPPPASAMKDAAGDVVDYEEDETLSQDSDADDVTISTKGSKAKGSKKKLPVGRKEVDKKKDNKSGKSGKKEATAAVTAVSPAKGRKGAAPDSSPKKTLPEKKGLKGVVAALSVGSTLGGKKKKGGPVEKVVEVTASAHVSEEYNDYAFRKVITDFLMNIPEWTAIAWEDAKISAMNYEARRYAAATRIAAKQRGGRVHYAYSRMKVNILAFQNNVRRKLVQLRLRKLMFMYKEDWIFRVRYFAAMLIQSVIRRFVKRCRHAIIMARVHSQEVLVQKARRFRLKKLRSTSRKAVVFKETVRVNGVIILLKILRSDTRNYSRDFGIIISVYSPESQMKFDFPIPEPMLRLFMQQELKVEVLNAGDLMDQHNLRRIVGARLIIRKSLRPGQPPRILFSKQALGQRGTKVMSHGRVINGYEFALSLYETGAEVTVQCYHRISCKIFICKISTFEMHKWVTDEYKTNCVNEMEMYKTPALLRPGAEKELRFWLLHHIIVDTRKGTFKLLFACQKEASKKLTAITTMQSAMRRALAQPRILALLDQIWLKMKMHPDDEENIYYMNQLTGDSRWDKPAILGDRELPSQPFNRWVPIAYWHENKHHVHYANPYTGKFTTFTATQAVFVVQSMVRNFFKGAFFLPVDEFRKVRLLVRDSDKEYERSKRLASVINNALVQLLVRLDFEATKPALAEANELSNSNPLVARANAIFLLAACEAPVGPNRERAMLLLKESEHRDPTAAKFHLATNMAKYALYRDPRNASCLLNLAVIEVLVNKNLKNSQRLFRRALAIAPFNEAVLENWKFLKDRFPEELPQNYLPESKLSMGDTSKGTKKRTIKGRVALEDPAWCGWVYVEVSSDIYFMNSKADQEATAAYWYHPSTGQSRHEDDPPIFPDEWAIRMQRSVFKEERFGLEHYYDPVTATYWQYHRMTETYQ